MSSPLHPRPILGILGGLGPYAHLLLEKKILDAARQHTGSLREQDLPEWILSSMPQTPDRTLAATEGAQSPVPWLVRSLRRLEPHRTSDGEEIPGAGLVLIPCNTAHVFLHELRAATSLPVLDMISLCAQRIAQLVEPGSAIGLLATSGTLKSGLYHRALTAEGLSPFSPLDLEEGEQVQRDFVMESIYGSSGSQQGGQLGLKNPNPKAISSARNTLLQAAEQLVKGLGCQALIAGCTEIPLALPEDEIFGVPLVDPLDVLAQEAVLRVYKAPQALPSLQERAGSSKPSVRITQGAGSPPAWRMSRFS